MSKLQELINDLCPNGVVFKKMWEITFWDKKFTGVEKHKQAETRKYNYFLAKELKELYSTIGDIKVINTYESNLYVEKEKVSKEIVEDEIVCIPWGGNPIVQYYNGKFITGDNRIAVVRDKEELNTKYLYYYMMNNLNLIASFYRGSGIKHPSMAKVLDLEVPIPPIEIQEEIVMILDNFTNLTAELTAELTAREKQFQHYMTYMLNNSKESKMLKICDIGKVAMCKRILKAQTDTSGDVPFYKIGTFGKEANAYITKELYDEYKSKYSFPQKGSILISASGTIGRLVVYDGNDAYFQDSNIVWVEHDETIVLNSYLKYIFLNHTWKSATGGTIARLYNDIILNTKFSIPPLEVQEKIVSILEKFESLSFNINEGLPAEIKKREQQYEYYRNKLLTFKEL